MYFNYYINIYIYIYFYEKTTRITFSHKIQSKIYMMIKKISHLNRLPSLNLF